MKWWALVVAKIAFLALLHLGLITWVVTYYPRDKMGTDLAFTFALMGINLFVYVVGYGFWFDQKYRCRTCLRRLRMPLETGYWSQATIFAPPRLEWICPYGHGTMSQEEILLSGGKPDKWKENDSDFWRAFEDAWRKD
jgi:hypothetical protein